MLAAAEKKARGSTIVRSSDAVNWKADCAFVATRQPAQLAGACGTNARHRSHFELLVL